MFLGATLIKFRSLVGLLSLYEPITVFHSAGELCTHFPPLSPLSFLSHHLICLSSSICLLTCVKISKLVSKFILHIKKSLPVCYIEGSTWSFLSRWLICLFIYFFFEGMNTFINCIIRLSGESRTGVSSLSKVA